MSHPVTPPTDVSVSCEYYNSKLFAGAEMVTTSQNGVLLSSERYLASPEGEALAMGSWPDLSLL